MSEQTQQITGLEVLRNTSASSCTLRGRPSLTLLDHDGSALRFNDHDGGDQMLTHASPSAVVLRRGARAYFAINQNECVGRDQASVRRMLVFVPGAHRPLALRLPRYSMLSLCASSDPAAREVDISPFELKVDRVLGR